jgi:hypothetical protein
VIDLKTLVIAGAVGAGLMALFVTIVFSAGFAVSLGRRVQRMGVVIDAIQVAEDGHLFVNRGAMLSLGATVGTIPATTTTLAATPTSTTLGKGE